MNPQAQPFSHGQQTGRGQTHLTQPPSRPPYPSSLPQQVAYPQHRYRQHHLLHALSAVVAWLAVMYCILHCRPLGPEAMAAGHGRGYPSAMAGPEQLQFGQMEPISGPYQAQVLLSL